MNHWTRAEQTCDRLITRLGPLGLATVMLLLIFTLPVPSVSQDADAQTMPPPLNTSSLRSIDLMQYYIFKGNWQGNYDDSVGTFSCGNSTLGDTPTYNELIKMTDSEDGTGYQTKVHAQTGACDADIGTLQQAHNFTFPNNVNITTLRLDYLSAFTSYFWLLSPDGTILGNVSLGGAGTHSTVYLNGSFNGVKYLNWIMNRATDASGPEARVLDIAAWDANNRTYPIEFSFGEYLAERAQNDKYRCDSTCTQFKTNNFTVPPGTGIYYAATLHKSPCSSSVSEAGSTHTVRHLSCYIPLLPTTTASELTFTILGSTYNHRDNLSFTIWAYNNAANLNRNAFLQNTSVAIDGITSPNSCADVSGNHCFRFPNWYFQTGDMYAFCSPGTYPDNDCKPSSGTSTQPFGNATCNNNNNGVCSNPAEIKSMYGFGYKALTGPFATIAFPSMGWGETSSTDPGVNPSLLMDLRNITTIAATLANSADNGQFTMGLDDQQYFYTGNVLYMVLAKISDTNICSVTNSTIKVNGADVELAIQSNAFNVALGAFVQYCGWILDDFMVVNNLNQSALGENVYFDNGLLGRTYEIELPTNLRYTDWRAPTTFSGRHAARTACHADDSFLFCFGNYDTQGISVPGATQTVLWRWNVQDQQTTEPIEGAKAFEVISSTAGLTDASGNVNITTTSTAVQWSLTKQGYNSQYLNFTFLNQDTIYVNATMSKLNSRPFNAIDCDIAGNNTLLCDSNATSDVGETCQELYGNDGGCRKGPVFGTGLKIFQFGCPRDISSSTQTFINNVTVTESETANSFTIALGTTETLANSLECLAGETTAIQSSTVDFEFTKPGYQTMGFSADWLDKTVIHLTPLFKTGTGTATVSVTVQNTTIIHGGVSKPASIIVLTTTSDAQQNILDDAAGTNPGVDELLVMLGAGIFGTSAAAKTMWGFAIFVTMVLGVVAVYFALTQTVPPGSLVGGVMVPAFAVVAYLGLWETWVLVLGILAIAGVIVYAIKGNGLGGGV